MKVALVHDYLGEFGGAERVLLALSEIWPEAPIYTAFYRKGPAWERFRNKDIRVSWAHYIPLFSTKLHSPLRFLAPLIWNSFNFSDYDLVITSASWFVTKGFGSRAGPTSPRLRGAIGKPIEICYCHTPPRYLYGYPTSVEWTKYLPVRIYGAVVAHFMRLYDFTAAQKVDYFIANSENVRQRIKKFYRREATVIYPPVDIPNSKFKVPNPKQIQNSKLKIQKEDYYLVVTRLVGGKGLEMAVEAANKLKIPLKVVGESAGYAMIYKDLVKRAGGNVEFLGYVEDSELAELYAGARAFLALAQDEDFGITPVEAMAAGTPVVAYKGGGYLESVVDPSTGPSTLSSGPKGSGQGATGVFFEEYTTESLVRAIKRLDKMKIRAEDCQKQAEKFSKERFKKAIKEFVEKHARVTRG